MTMRISRLPPWLSPSAAWLPVASFAVTIGVFYWLLALRADVFDPTDVPIFWRLFLFQDYWAALAMVPVMMLAFAPPVQRAAGRAAELFGSHPRAVAAAAGVAFAAGAYFLYHAHPLSMDEYAASFQSQVFAAGRVTGQIPPELADWVVPVNFQGHFINVSHDSGRIASVYWPGFALLLAPFSAVGVPWLLNPLLSAVTLLAIHAVTRRLAQSESAAGMAVLLTLASQAFTINAISFYSMNAHLLFNLLFAWLLIDATPRRAFAAGIIGSIALTLHNPVPHLLFAVPWVLSVLFYSDTRRVFPALIAGYLPLALILGFGWSYLSSSLFPGPAGTAAEAGFVSHWFTKLGQIVSLPDGDLLLARLAGVAKLWLWASPGVVLLAVVGANAWRSERTARLLGLSALTTIVGFLFIPFDQGHGWGFRYFHSAWAAVPILAALALQAARHPGVRSDTSTIDLRSWVVPCALVWLVAGTALRFLQVEGFIAQHLAQLPRAELGSVPVRIVNPVNGYYAVDLIQNDPFLRGSIVFVTQGREQDTAMMAKEFPHLELMTREFRGQVWAERR